jgi:hypothetical protein
MGKHPAACLGHPARTDRRAPRPPVAWAVLGLLAAGLLLPLPSAAPAEPSDGFAAVRALEAAHRDALVELFEWCRTSRLNLEADKVAKEVLELDPDHEAARRWLGFKRKDGEWLPPKRPKTRRNWNRSAAKTYPGRRADMLRELVDRYWALHERLTQPDDAEARRHLRALALQHWPDDARFHQAAGEILRNGAWILIESTRSRAVQQRLERNARQLMEAAPVATPCDTPALLQQLDFDCIGAARCKNVTVCSGTSVQEASNVARHCVAAAALFRLVFGVNTSLPPSYTVALGNGYSDVQKMVASLDLPESVKRWYRDSAGFYLPGLALDFSSAAHAEYRLEASIRGVIKNLSRRAYGGFGNLGWRDESVVTYLVWLLCGTRLVSDSMLPEHSQAGDGGRSDARDGSDAWLPQAARLASKGRLPELPYIVSVELNAMEREDVIGAYAFGVYLVTAQPGKVSAFLHASNAGRSTDDASRRVFDLSLPELDLRFRRWLRECYSD